MRGWCCSGCCLIADIVIADTASDMAIDKKPHPPGAIVASDAETESFVKGLVDRGEAAKADADGKLPPGATHEIVGETETGLPVVVRRRFSAY
jgi:hypothetical protein